MTTPNLVSWYNRIFMLFGYQPIFSEVSLKYGVGHPFKFWLKAGHIRLFTLRALKELVKIHNFRIVQVKGFGINTNLGYGKKFKPLAILFNFLFNKIPSLSSDIMIVMRKKVG